MTVKRKITNGLLAIGTSFMLIFAVAAPATAAVLINTPQVRCGNTVSAPANRRSTNLRITRTCNAGWWGSARVMSMDGAGRVFVRDSTLIRLATQEASISALPSHPHIVGNGFGEWN